MNLNRNKFWILISIIIATAILLTLFTAPSNNKLLTGSTFGKSPNGYGAWYEYMKDQDANIQRWQKPFSELKDSKNKTSFLKILPPKKNYRLSGIEKKWIQQGNTMVVLGIDATPTDADFNTTQSYQNLNVKIATTRRKKLAGNSILKDNYGSIVWQEKIDRGKIIYALTPYIAANAYQDILDNYQFLAQLVNQNSLILVDEYLHGYKDREIIQKENKSQQNTVLNYFSKTVWLPIAIQGVIIAIIATSSSLFRFGKSIVIPKVKIDNSQAYIQALAGVLEKAECSNFVVQTITKDEKIQLQKFLGLGKANISDETLLNAWGETTGKNSQQLEKLLKLSQSNSRFNYSQLVQWLRQWQQFR